MGYRTFEHTADVGIEAWGEDLAEAFEDVAGGLFSLMVDLDEVVERVERTHVIHATDREGLLVAWLNELIGLVDTEGLIFRRSTVERISERDLIVRSYGETLDPSRHAPHLVVKAATYHDIRVDAGPPARVRVIVDI